MNIGFEYITHQSQSGSLLRDIQDVAEIGLDIEASSLHPHEATLLLLQIKANENIYVIDVQKTGIEFVTYVISLIKERNILCIGHNIKYDIKLLYHNTKEILTKVYDTMVGETLCYQGIGKQLYSYSELVETYCFTLLSKQVRDSFKNFNGEITQEQIKYSAMDVEFLDELKDIQLAKLQDQGQDKILKLEMKVTPVFALMEYFGITLDQELWKENIKEAEKNSELYHDEIINHLVEELSKQNFKNILEVADILRIPHPTKTLTNHLESLSFEFGKDWIVENFNVGSWQQIKAMLLYFGVDVPSTNEKVLKKFKHPMIDKILKYREEGKKLSTYGYSFLENINKTTGKIHTEFNQVGTQTGRVSSTTPNLQNIISDKSYRQPFKASDGYVIVTADYNQAELRLTGAISREPRIIEAYQNEQDLHRLTASIIYEIDPEEVTYEQRQRAKNINFGTIYLISAWGLFNQFDIPKEDGEVFLDNFFKGYPILKHSLKMIGDQVCNKFYSITPLGRRRFFEKRELFVDYKDRNKYYAEMRREGVNHVIQGGSADIVKLAMALIFYTNPWTHDDLRILLQVHDELVIEVREELVDEAVPFIINCMEKVEQPFLKEIPAKADYVVRDYWSKG